MDNEELEEITDDNLFEKSDRFSIIAYILIFVAICILICGLRFLI